MYIILNLKTLVFVCRVFTQLFDALSSPVFLLTPFKKLVVGVLCSLFEIICEYAEFAKPTAGPQGELL